MKIEIEVVKRANSPDYLLKGKKSGLWHRFGEEDTFGELVGDFPAEIEELNIANEVIGSPLYLISSFWKLLSAFLTNLKGK